MSVMRDLLKIPAHRFSRGPVLADRVILQRTIPCYKTEIDQIHFFRLMLFRLQGVYDEVRKHVNSARAHTHTHTHAGVSGLFSTRSAAAPQLQLRS